jgi:hypothetical protein
MSDAHSPKTGTWLTFAAVIGGFAIFAIIVAIAYLPKSSGPAAEGTRTPEERARILAEHRAKESTVAKTYGWIDQSKGIVQLPIDRAMELTVQEINAKK